MPLAREKGKEAGQFYIAPGQEETHLGSKQNSRSSSKNAQFI